MLLVARTPTGESGEAPMISPTSSPSLAPEYPAANEFEFGVFEHSLDRRDADGPGCPLHHPQGHEHF